MTDISDSFKSLSHPIRVQILLILAEQLNNGSQFSDISRELRIESSSKLSFHIEKLQDFLSQDESGRYFLNTKGQKAVDAIKLLGIEGRDPKEISEMMSPSIITVEHEQGFDDSPVKPTVDTSDTSDQTDKNSTGLFNYNYGFVTGTGFLYNVLIALGIPIIFLALLSDDVDNSMQFFVAIILMAIFAFSTGIFVAFLTSKQESELAWKDIGLINSIISSFAIFAVLRLALGGTFQIIFFIINFAIISLGSYFYIQLSNQEISSVHLIPKGLENKIVPTVFILFAILTYPIYQKKIYTLLVYSTSNGEQFISSSNYFILTSETIGSQGFAGLGLTVFLIGIFYIIPTSRSIKDWKLYLVALLFSLYRIIQFAGRYRYGSYDNALQTNREDGLIWILVDGLGVLAFVLGSITAVYFVLQHFRSTRNYSSTD